MMSNLSIRYPNKNHNSYLKLEKLSLLQKQKAPHFNEELYSTRIKNNLFYKPG